MYKLLTALVIALLLTACGKELEWRNAEVSNGMVFEQGANEGFTGMVYNIPASAIVIGQSDFSMPLYRDNPRINQTGLTVDLHRSHCAADFKKGIRDGLLECYRQDGTVVLEMLYDNGAPSGIGNLYGASGDQLASVNFD